MNIYNEKKRKEDIKAEINKYLKEKITFTFFKSYQLKFI